MAIMSNIPFIFFWTFTCNNFNARDMFHKKCRITKHFTNDAFWFLCFLVIHELYTDDEKRKIGWLSRTCKLSLYRMYIAFNQKFSTIYSALMFTVCWKIDSKGNWSFPQVITKLFGHLQSNQRHYLNFQI